MEFIYAYPMGTPGGRVVDALAAAEAEATRRARELDLVEPVASPDSLPEQ
jgi:hypothetical protein